MTLAVVSAPEPDLLGAAEQRIVDAALRCIARWGVAKTTLDDVARDAGCSRATVYRLFPGGKDAVMEATARTEVARFFAGITARLRQADTLEALLVAGMTEAAQRILGHPALQYLLAHEPEAVLPRLAFAQLDQVLACAAAFAAPHLSRFIDDQDDARRAAEWVARLVVSYSSTPAPGVDLTDEASVRTLVRSFVLPGLTQNANAPLQGGTTNGQDA
jgi:AcrR family transcriptional regulator